MATKWRNRLGLVACVLLFTFGLNGLITSLDHAGSYFKKDYFHTAEFAAELNQFIDELSIYELNYVSKDEAKRAITVTREEIETHRYYYGSLPDQLANIKQQYESKINEARETGSPEIAQMYIEERDAKLEDITNNFKSDEHVRKKIVREKETILDEYYRQLEIQRQKFLKKKETYTYYLQNTATGDVYTNLVPRDGEPSLLFAKEEDWYYVHSFYPGKAGYLYTGDHYPPIVDLAASSYDYQEILAASWRGGTFEGYIAVPKTAQANTPIMKAYHDYQKRQLIFFVHSLSALVALVFSLYMYRKLPVRQVLALPEWEVYYNRLPIDLRVFLFLLTILSTWLGLTIWLPVYYSVNILTVIDDLLIHLCVTALCLLASLLQGIYLRKRWENKQEWRADWHKSLIMRCYQVLSEAFLNRKLGTQLTFLLAIVFCLGAGLMIIPLEPVFMLVYAPVCFFIGLPTLFILLRQIGYLNRIVQHTEQLAEGHLEPDLQIKGKSVLANLASHINTLKRGVKLSQQEQIKSERLKTELITNVSHDLRTPLTSIITYTELLKNNELSAEDRAAYVQIIDRKSKRLKVLIDDLFEVSKMASGNMELNKEKVDLVQLLKQALAEYDEQISQSKLNFRVSYPDKPVYALVDGQKIWRVFDNLISNILKYSLEETRVYISIESKWDQIKLTFKNITKYELGENSEEMLERFKRGDTSRHTDGSGLGLAIAKSIIDLHQGDLVLEVDGDLFKVTITLAKLPQ